MKKLHDTLGWLAILVLAGVNVAIVAHVYLSLPEVFPFVLAGISAILIILLVLATIEVEGDDDRDEKPF